ncbi:MAG: hypothetical protein AAF638_14290 [Pseudomonadota bacterium]
MPRPAGVRNRDFAEKRMALLDTLCDFALGSDLRRPSLRQFAMAASASEPTLRHYFKDRQGVVVAILERIGARGGPLWQTISLPAKTMATALEEYFRVSEAGMRHGGFIRAHAFGIIEGVADPVAAKAYLKNVLEPALGAVESKLAASGEGLSDHKLMRAAALAALAPHAGHVPAPGSARRTG